MNKPSAELDAIFFAALELDSDEARTAYLDQACGTDQDLRRRVERLLAAQPQQATSTGS